MASAERGWSRAARGAALRLCPALRGDCASEEETLEDRGTASSRRRPGPSRPPLSPGRAPAAPSGLAALPERGTSPGSHGGGGRRGAEPSLSATPPRKNAGAHSAHFSSSKGFRLCFFGSGTRVGQKTLSRESLSLLRDTCREVKDCNAPALQVLPLRVKHRRKKPHAAPNAGTAASQRRRFGDISWNRVLPPTQDFRATSNQQGFHPSRGTDVSLGAVPCVSTALPGRAVPGTAVGAPRELSPELFPCPTSRVSPVSRPPSEPLAESTDPRDAPRAPRAPSLPPLSAGAVSARPVLGLSAGEGRGGREGRGRRDVADKLRLFCRRQERGDEREAPGGSGCAV
ncbi:uncharacterized protein LOC110405499 [Numida meleagris]|uniref:uncharacterized protein LOC110405499 n=1 Tax=Numida meleagris TaxID=8996 RepID=UPI000B3DAF64|nr:uncharacterized protein LOC110405499 [Numida meleagris]